MEGQIEKLITRKRLWDERSDRYSIFISLSDEFLSMAEDDSASTLFITTSARIILEGKIGAPLDGARNTVFIETKSPTSQKIEKFYSRIQELNRRPRAELEIEIAN